jgi:hypothetical protein
MPVGSLTPEFPVVPFVQTGYTGQRRWKGIFMAEPNPTTVIADCIEKSKATTDQEVISDYISEALGLLQIENNEEDAFTMLGGAIVDAVADDPAHTEGLLEVWSELEEQRKLQ